MQNEEQNLNEAQTGNSIKADVISSKIILVHEKDFKIEQSRMIVEHFIWKCPHCAKDNKTLEFNVHDSKLWCSGCYQYTDYAWK